MPNARSQFRAILPAIIAAIVIGALLYGAFRGSGFSYAFLLEPTNWDIGFSFLSFSPQNPYWWAFLVGLSNTLIAGATAIVLATLLGFVLGLIRSSSNPMLSGISRFYTDVIRNIPVILQAMFWYALYLGMPNARNAMDVLGAKISNRGFFIPWFADPGIGLSVIFSIFIAIICCFILIGRIRRKSFGLSFGTAFLSVAFIGSIGWLFSIFPEISKDIAIEWPQQRGLSIQGGLRLPIEFAALVTALTFYRAAYIAEVFRAGFKSVSQGHLDAAHALSLSPWTTLVKVRIPLALITILPPLTSEFIVIIKVTSIGLLVGYNDLYAVSVNSTTVTGRTLEIMALMSLCYLVINFGIATVMNLLNKRVAFRGSKRA